MFLKRERSEEKVHYPRQGKAVRSEFFTRNENPERLLDPQKGDRTLGQWLYFTSRKVRHKIQSFQLGKGLCAPACSSGLHRPCGLGK